MCQETTCIFSTHVVNKPAKILENLQILLHCAERNISLNQSIDSSIHDYVFNTVSIYNNKRYSLDGFI